MNAMTQTASIMHHVLSSGSGVNTKGNQRPRTGARVSRVVLKKPVIVHILPGSGMTSGDHNGTKTSRVGVTRYVQWYDPAHRGKYSIQGRQPVKGITGKLTYQGKDERGNALWS